MSHETSLDHIEVDYLDHAGVRHTLEVVEVWRDLLTKRLIVHVQPASPPAAETGLREELETLVVTWRDAATAAWERGNAQYANALDHCADDVAARVSGQPVGPPASTD